MNAIFGVTNKPMNSTSRRMTDTTTLTVKLKERCSKHNPIFIVEGLNKTRRYNYVNWNNSYYYIDDVIFVTNDIQEVHCRLDPMSTFRDQMKYVTGMAVYADEAHWADTIDDIRFCPDTIVHSVCGHARANTGDTFWNWSMTNSTVILDVIQTLGTDSGFKRYVLSVATYRQALMFLNSSALDDAVYEFSTGGSTYQNLLSQAGKDLANIIGSFGGGTWQDCITRALWVPIDISYWGTGGWKTEIMIGGCRVPTNGGAKLIEDTVRMQKSHIFLNKSDLYGTSIMEDLKFLRNPRWVSIQVRTPGGTQTINNPILREDSTWPLNMNTNIDTVSGNWNMTITTEPLQAGASGYYKNSQILARFEGNCSVDLTYWANNRGNLGTMVVNTSSKIIPAVFGGGSFDTEVSSVTTHNKNVITEDNSQVWSSGSVTKNIAKLDRGTITTNENSVTTGKKGTALPSIQNGIAEFSCNGNQIANYNFANFTQDDNVLAMGASFYTICWGPNSFINDADPYEAYKDYCDLYGYPCNQVLLLDDVTHHSYVQFSNAIMHVCEGATEDDIKTINFYLNDGFIWDILEV